MNDDLRLSVFTTMKTYTRWEQYENLMNINEDFYKLCCRYLDFHDAYDILEQFNKLKKTERKKKMFYFWQKKNQSHNTVLMKKVGEICRISLSVSEEKSETLLELVNRFNEDIYHMTLLREKKLYFRKIKNDLHFNFERSKTNFKIIFIENKL